MRHLRGVVLLFLLGALACAGIATAQSVSPAIVRYTGAAEGSFEIANVGIAPLIAIVEAKGFTIGDDGTVSFARLPAGVHVELSQMSVRVPPKQRRTIYYKASADSYPAWFTLYSNISGLPKRDGMNVMLSLPHTVYLLGKQVPDRKALRWSDLRQDGATVSATLHNDGGEVIRVNAVDAIYNHHTLGISGFPLLPHSQRIVRLELPPNTRAQVVKARTEAFAAEQTMP